MSSVDFSQLYLYLGTLEERIYTGMVNGLQEGASVLQDLAQATSAYQDDTGATRAGTVAAVISTLDDGGGRLVGAVEVADSLNPGHGQQNVDLSPSEGLVHLVLTSQTDYAIFLETAHGGRNAFIQSSMQQFTPQAMAYAQAGVDQAVQGGT